MRIILCRHGETDYNVARRLQGTLETPLNKRGINQARLVAAKLKNEKFDVILSSSLKRCRDTVKEIGAYHSNKVVFRDDLREIDLGIYSGMDKQEIEEKFPGHWAKRVDNKYSFEHEGGESYKEVDEKKIKPFIKELQEKYSSRTVLVVTHEGVCRLLLGNLLGLDAHNKMNIKFPNDCIYFIDYLAHKTEVEFYLAENGIEGAGYLKRISIEIG